MGSRSSEQESVSRRKFLRKIALATAVGVGVAGAGATVVGPSTAASTDQLVKATSTDMIAGYLSGSTNPKIAAGTRIATSLLNPMANAQLQISVSDEVMPSAYVIWQNGSTILARNGKTGTDDYSGADAATVIQSAINAVTNGGSIFIKQGTYQVTAPIELKSGLRIYSDAAYLFALGTESAWTVLPAGHYGMFQTSNVSDIIIDGLKFDARGNACAFSSFGHSNLRFQNCDFTSSTSSAPFGGLLNFDGQLGSAMMRQTTIQNCYFHDTALSQARVLHLYPRSGHIIDGFWVDKCTFENIGGHAIDLDAYDTCRDIHISNNRFIDLIGNVTGSGTYASAVFGGLASPYQIFDVFVTNNYYRNTRNSIRQVFVGIYASTNILIQGNNAITTGSSIEGPCIAPGATTNPDRNLRIIGNYVEGFDAFWDPDSMTRTEVADNIIVGTTNTVTGQPTNGLNLGYGTQQYVWIHDNIAYNAVAGAYGAGMLFGNSSPLKAVVENNIVVDDRASGSTFMSKAIEITGGFDFSDVLVRNNRFYLPNSAFTDFLFKEHGNETTPRLLLRNERHDSTGVKFFDGIASIPVGGSPFTYTNIDSVPEAIYLYGGALTSPYVQKNGVTIFNNTPCTVWLESGESVTVAYSSAPIMLKDRK